MPTREQEYAEVRDLLGYPKEQKPNPHQIVSQLIREEQFQSNKLNNNSRPFSVGATPATVTTSAGTAEYTISASGFGKPLFVYRELANNQILPVPYADYQHELHNQTYDFRAVPMESGVYTHQTGEKLAFFRLNNGLIKCRVYPVPAEARTYKVSYATGWNDWTDFALSDIPILPEWSNLRCKRAAFALLPYAEWEGYSMDEADAKRRSIGTVLALQIEEEKEEFRRFIRNPQGSEPVDDVGYYWER